MAAAIEIRLTRSTDAAVVAHIARAAVERFGMVGLGAIADGT